MNAMATKLDLADAQFIGYSHGRFESLLDMVASMGLTENEWEKWKKDYPTNCLRQQEIDEIDYYFFKMKTRDRRKQQKNPAKK
jgi:hypothetical protein